MRDSRHHSSDLNPSTTNKNYETTEEYDSLRKLVTPKIAIIVVHHCKKTTDVSMAPLEKVIGSIGITGTAETILVMEQLTGTQDCVYCNRQGCGAMRETSSLERSRV